jgi:hypothetical protein
MMETGRDRNHSAARSYRRDLNRNAALQKVCDAQVAATATTSVSPNTDSGSGAFPINPSPNWERSLSPQVRMVPAGCCAIVKLAPMAKIVKKRAALIAPEIFFKVAALLMAGP